MTISTDIVIDATVTVRRTSLRGPYGHASGDGNGDAGARCLVNTPEFAFSLRSRRRWVCGFARCVRSHAAAVQARSALMRPPTSRQSRRSRGVSRTLPHERVERLSCRSGGITFAVHMDRRLKDGTAKSHNESGGRSRIRVRGERRLCANAGDNNQRSTDIRGQDQSAAAHGPGGDQSVRHALADADTAEQQLDGHARGEIRTRVQSNLVFQPLMSLRLTEKQGLVIRPMVTIVNSVPHFDQNGQNERTAGFGDTVLAFALPRSLLGGRLMVGAGPTFMFPTASTDLLSQDTWQVGPDAGATVLGKNFIAYAFVQQWFKVGGDGEDTNQMNGTFNFTYMLAKRVHDRHPAEPLGRLGGARRQPSGIFDRTTDRKALQMRRHCRRCSSCRCSTTPFVRTPPVRSGTFSCRRRRRFRPSSRERSSESRGRHRCSRTCDKRKGNAYVDD